MEWKYDLRKFIQNKAQENPNRYNHLILTVYDACIQSIACEGMIRVGPTTMEWAQDTYTTQFKADVKRKSKALGISEVRYYKALKILLEDKIINKGDKTGYYTFNKETVEKAYNIYNTYILNRTKTKMQESNIREKIIAKMLDNGFTSDEIFNIL